jgi:hypothetical protein
MMIVEVSHKVDYMPDRTAIVEMFADRLTPRVARAALLTAGMLSGTAWSGEIGYRVYANSARKLYRALPPEEKLSARMLEIQRAAWGGEIGYREYIDSCRRDV